ncbi:Myb transcription factor [Quillaja saponaria]|uniref:Myb transcription factor n=1 Tax=Quillaja saponaria TaxID=32244 RepID=A0AAD7L0S2_QUISA|nr:Myb transcription factor [Quillaja saponaria]
METQFDETYIKKGPWSKEEDEVLINHVKKFGPREWSSIRSNGLLPRTGKSCRLRWVNKLRPNLKNGCKFSAEEERLVIELQAQFGNKWAKIATYLHGRTDNDVKNFWSSRRKRLERILQKTSPSKSQKNKGKNPLVHQSKVAEVKILVNPCSDSLQEDPSCWKCPTYTTSSFGTSYEFKMVPVPDLVKPNFPNLEINLPAVEATPTHIIPSLESSLEYCFPKLAQFQPDLQFLPECQDIPQEHYDSNFENMFEQQEVSEPATSQNFGTRLPPLELERNSLNAKQDRNENPPTAVSFFEDFPVDMFDYFEQLP